MKKSKCEDQTCEIEFANAILQEYLIANHVWLY